MRKIITQTAARNIACLLKEFRDQKTMSRRQIHLLRIFYRTPSELVDEIIDCICYFKTICNIKIVKSEINPMDDQFTVEF